MGDEPETKICEPWCGKSRPRGALYTPCRDGNGKCRATVGSNEPCACSDECRAAGRPLNPLPGTEAPELSRVVASLEDDKAFWKARASEATSESLMRIAALEAELAEAKAATSLAREALETYVADSNRHEAAAVQAERERCADGFHAWWTDHPTMADKDAADFEAWIKNGDPEP